MSPEAVAVKPLGAKAYGSIGHIHGSRLGPGDHHVHEGQSAICTTEAPKGKDVWVQAKLDGSCVAAALLESGELVALGRAGYLARSSNYEMHHLWADWVDANADRFHAILKPGERIVGEWLAQAHGTRYNLTDREPFVAFDIMTGSTRLPLLDFEHRVEGVEEQVRENAFAIPDRMIGARPIAPEVAFAQLDHYGAEEPEGVIYRVESVKNGARRVEYLAKWVRPDKVDGKYLDSVTGEASVWNWRPQGSL